MSGITKRISNEWGNAHIENVKALLARADTREKLDDIDTYKANYELINWGKQKKKKKNGKTENK